MKIYNRGNLEVTVNKEGDWEVNTNCSDEDFINDFDFTDFTSVEGDYLKIGNLSYPLYDVAKNVMTNTDKRCWVADSIDSEAENIQDEFEQHGDCIEQALEELGFEEEK